GWPALLPVRHLETLDRVDAERGPDDVVFDLGASGVPIRLLDLGDPGTTHDRSVPIASLPPYDGPPEPAARHTHEWGAALADEPEVARPARHEIELTEQRPDDCRDDHRRRGRDGDRSGGPPQVAATGADDQQVAGIREGGDRAQPDPEGRVRAVGPGADHPGD